jgi:hypothetical protein
MSECKELTSEIDKDKCYIDYCHKNPHDEKCKCINPPNNIHLHPESLNHYYCWYPPCKNDQKYFITSIIKRERGYCNGFECSTNLNYVSLQDNDLNVENNCKKYSVKSSIKFDKFGYSYLFEPTSFLYGINTFFFCLFLFLTILILRF